MRNFVRYLAVLTAIAALWVLTTAVGDESSSSERTSSVDSETASGGVNDSGAAAGTAPFAGDRGAVSGARLAAAIASRPVGALRPPAGAANKPVINGPRGPEVADELVVRFATGTDAATSARIAADAGAEVVWTGTRTGAAILRFDDRAAQRRGRSRLAAHAAVVAVGPNLVMEAASAGVSSEQLRGLQWHLDALGLGGAEAGRADGVVVAVLDTGAAYETAGPYAVAPDLAGVDFVAGYDFVNGDEFANDDQGHGTHITAILAASDGARSVAPGAAVVPVKVLDAENRGTEVALAEGLRFAVDAGAQVVNMSLSFSPGYFPSRLMQDAISYAVGKGAVLVAAAGNHGAPTVTYPAAFRDVIAVGATSLRPASEPGGGPWGNGSHEVKEAYYSNTGYLLDLSAPGGDILSDADGDGNPEAVLAQSFAHGDPTDFGYYFYAGTSQATAQVSGLAARMLAADPTLTPDEIRHALGSTAESAEGQVLSESFGRGILRGENALLAATEIGALPDTDRPRFFATMFVTLESLGAQRVARAEVEVVDEDGMPAAGVRVYGTFSGAVDASDSLLTGIDGSAVFRSPGFDAAGTLVGFQVDAVATTGADGIVDRPRGFMRIDSLSLEMLANFGLGPLVASDAPVAPADGDAAEPTEGESPGPADDTATVDTEPEDPASPGETASGEMEGSGIGTSSSHEPFPPGVLANFGIGRSPIALRFAPELQSANAVPSVQFANFGWGLATAPMVVVADSEWLYGQFPEAQQASVTTFGKGLGASPVRFDAATSFAEPIDLSHYDELPEASSLLVLTFFGADGLGLTVGGTEGCGIGTSSAENTCVEGSGIGTSTNRPRPILVDHYFAIQEPEIDVVLDSLWTSHTTEITGSGIGTSAYTGQGTVIGVSEPLLDHLGFMTERYVPFAADEIASPVGQYGDLLDAAGLEGDWASRTPAAASVRSTPVKLD